VFNAFLQSLRGRREEERSMHIPDVKPLAGLRRIPKGSLERRVTYASAVSTMISRLEVSAQVSATDDSIGQKHNSTIFQKEKMESSCFHFGTTRRRIREKSRRACREKRWGKRR
jgi:hypothetical protein